VICLEGGVTGRQPGTIIAEEFIKNGSVITKDLIKEGTGMLAIIDLHLIERILNKNISDIIQKSHAMTHEKMMVQEVTKQDYSHLTLDKMLFIKKLGEGQFGKVFLVKDSQSGHFYATKCISKHQIVQSKMELIIH
jgi:cGMP-dependent protein kinase